MKGFSCDCLLSLNIVGNMRSLFALFSSCSRRIRYKSFSSAQSRYLFAAKRGNSKFNGFSNLESVGAATTLGFISICIYSDPRELREYCDFKLVKLEDFSE